MNMRIRLIGVALCAVAGIASAEAGDVRPGYYQLTVGSTPSCKLTLGEDGAASVVQDCNKLGAVARWKATETGFDLTDTGGTTLASLKEGNDAYTGHTADGSHRVMVAR
jgi:hypothetical protein